MTYLTFENETEERLGDHQASDEDEEQAKKALARAGLQLDEDGNLIDASEAAKRVQICSCGFYTCPAIVRYGHPVPVFKEDIEPLFPQSRRDERALELKGEE